MILALLATALLLLPSAAGAATQSYSFTIAAGTAATSEEFVGPFASWVCARTAASGTCGIAAASFCNANGTEGADDQTAIQLCINALNATNPVLYFPCGTYNIGTTLVIANKTAISLIGQDNSTGSGRCTTNLKWTGATGGTLIEINGIVYSQLSRLTFDGNSLANILVDQIWNGSTGPFDASNQYIDDVFKNADNNTTSYGLNCGAAGLGCSETTVLRSTFLNVGRGVAPRNANALDTGIWDSSFTNTSYGIYAPAGAYHAVGNVFSGSVVVDVHSGSSTPSILLDNYSSNSTKFHNGTNSTLQRNTVINTSLGGTTNTGSIYFNGNAVMLDNNIQNTNTGPIYVGVDSMVLSIGNKFTRANPYQGIAMDIANRNFLSGDQTIAYAPPPVPVLPGTPTNHGRTIYEASSLGLQTAICKASNGAGSTFSGGACTGSPDGLKNVAHLAASGTYTPTSTVIVPANSNAQIIGDGWNTTVSSTAANPVFQVNGPSKAVLRGFRVYSGAVTTGRIGIDISGVDQVGSYLYTRGARWGGIVGGTSATSLNMNGLTNTLVDAHNFQYPYNGTSSHDIIQSGSNHFRQFGGTGGTRAVSGAAKFQIMGAWLEAATAVQQSTITGTSSYIHSTAFMQFPPATTAFTLNNFSGNFVLLNTPVIMVAGDCPYTGYVVNTTGTGTGLVVEAFGAFPSPPSHMLLNGAGNTVKAFGNAAYTNVDVSNNCIDNAGVTDSPNPITSGDLTTIATALGYQRKAMTMSPYPTPAGVSAAELYDMAVEGFATAVRVSP